MSLYYFVAFTKKENDVNRLTSNVYSSKDDHKNEFKNGIGFYLSLSPLFIEN